MQVHYCNDNKSIGLHLLPSRLSQLGSRMRNGCRKFSTAVPNCVLDPTMATMMREFVLSRASAAVVNQIELETRSQA
jgi:hypothetical protein